MRRRKGTIRVVIKLSTNTYKGIMNTVHRNIILDIHMEEIKTVKNIASKHHFLLVYDDE